MLWAGSNNFTRSVHHVWILNSIISGYDQSGIQMNQGEYFYAIHNTIFNNANSAPGGCGAQGSGISFFKQIGVPGYTPTPDDLNNPMIGNVGSAFHNAIEWNVLYNNATTIACGGGNSDGNNIIIDTWNWAGVSGAIPYAGGGLVAFNVAYNAGGAGIALTNSLGVTVANNTCYNNFLDPNNPGSWRGCINSAGYAGSYGNTIINNIAIAVPAAHGTCAYNTPPYAMWNLAILAWPPTSGSLPLDTFSNNITQIQGGSTSCWRSDVKMYNGDSYSTTTNKLNTDPMFLDAGRTSVGTATTPPVGANFALQPGSPAIGYGLAKPYLSPQSVDVGACHHTLTACP
jgi:parallel beta-helix repeat protein